MRPPPIVPSPSIPPFPQLFPLIFETHPLTELIPIHDCGLLLETNMSHMSRWRWTYVVLGLTLRIALLFWGTYQDKHASLPYTDVDYAVYNDGARALWTSCPLSATIDSKLYEDEEDLLNVPELAENVHCARGLIPAVSRFVLKNDPARSDTATMEWDPAWTPYLIFSYAWTRPLFRFLGSLGDPFVRTTYRYTPLLAMLLAPGHAQDSADGDGMWTWLGKLIFALADVGCGIMMWAILDERQAMHAYEAPALRHAKLLTHLPGTLWLVNPFPAQIATRGSSDSLVGLLVLAFLYLLIRATPEMSLVRTPVLESDKLPPRHDPSDLRVASTSCFYGAAFCLALAVHVKIYPVIYGASVLAHLANYQHYALVMLCGIPKPKRWDVLRLGLRFGVCAAAFCAVLTAFAWGIWGEPYIRHALLYHVVRQDHRHNFSVYFLPTYLSLDHSALSHLAALAPWLRQAAELLSFVPQLLTVGFAGFALGGKDLVMACTVQTIVFVAWNKVYTSQVCWHRLFIV